MLPEPGNRAGLPRARPDGRPRSLRAARGAQSGDHRLSRIVLRRRGRPAIACGAGRQCYWWGDWAADRMVPDMVRAIAAGESVLVRNPKAIRPWQHVLEPVAGYLRSPSGFVPLQGIFRRAGISARTTRTRFRSRSSYPQSPDCGVRPPAGPRTRAASTRGSLPEARQHQGAHAPGLAPAIAVAGRSGVDRGLVQEAGARRRCSATDACTDRSATWRSHRHDAGKLPLLRSAAQAFVCDLGMSPPSNAYLKAEDLNRMERFYPLHAWVCENCFLVQLEEFETPRGDLHATTPTSPPTRTRWLEHARRYTRADDASASASAPAAWSSRSPATTATCCSTSSSTGVPVLGIEPAANVARASPRRRACRRWCSSSARETATRPRRAPGAGRPAARQQRARARARTSTTSSPA